jgi:P-type conjugative transfer protein TrbL
MIRAILLSLLFAFAVPAFAMPAKAAAADEKILDATIDRYMREASKWEPRIKQAARSMFWILATISMVFTFAFMFARGNVGLGDFFGEFLKFIVTTGFFYWLLENGSEIARAIITSFGQLGREASSTYQEELSPTNLLWFALDLVVRSCASFGEQDIATGVIALLLSIAIAVLFAVIAAMMVLLLCSAWVLVYAGVIYLGFGGGRWTSDIAVNYFKTVLGLAVQTFTFCLLVGIGQQQIERLLAESTQAKMVTVKGYVYDSTITTTSMTITEACIILVFTVVLFMLVKTVPQMVAGVVSGSSTGGIHLGGSGSAVTGAAAVASGGAMIAMQAAGAGMALNSAYQQAQTNMAEGMGKFAGATFSGGLSGARDKGLTFASVMMSNLVSGAKETAADNLQ